MKRFKNQSSSIRKIECHPIFKLVEDEIEEWERVKLR